MLAVMSGSMELCELLLTACASLPPYLGICSNERGQGRSQALVMMTSLPFPSAPLPFAAAGVVVFGGGGVVLALLDDNGCPALFHALAVGAIAIAALLLDAGGCCWGRDAAGEVGEDRGSSAPVLVRTARGEFPHAPV